MKTLNFSFSYFPAQKNKIQQPEAMDPINALQNLTNQGTRNPMPTQMMNMGNQLGMGNVNTNPNVNVLQNLINVSANCFYFTLKIVLISLIYLTAWCSWTGTNAIDAKYSRCCTAECNG